MVAESGLSAAGFLTKVTCGPGKSRITSAFVLMFVPIMWMVLSLPDIMITSDQSNLIKMSQLASPPHTDGSKVFARWRQCAPPYDMCWFLGPIRVHNPNGISIGSANFAQLTIVTDPNGISIGSANFARLTIVTDRQTNWPTDHATRSVAMAATAMRPNNITMQRLTRRVSVVHRGISGARESHDSLWIAVSSERSLYARSQFYRKVFSLHW